MQQKIVITQEIEFRNIITKINIVLIANVKAPQQLKKQRGILVFEYTQRQANRSQTCANDGVIRRIKREVGRIEKQRRGQKKRDVEMRKLLEKCKVGVLTNRTKFIN